MSVLTCMLHALTIQPVLIYIFSLIAIHDDPVKKLHPAGKELQHGGHIPLHFSLFSRPNHWNFLCLPVMVQIEGEVHHFSTTSNTKSNCRKAFQTCGMPGIFIMFLSCFLQSHFMLPVGFLCLECNSKQGWHRIPLHCCSVDSFYSHCEWVKLCQIYFYKLWCIFAADMNDKLVWLGVFELSCYFSKWFNARFSPSSPINR